MKKEPITYRVSSDSDGGNRPSIIHSYAEDEDCKYYSGTMKKESQQEQQEQHQHPYASLYEPLLFATEPVEVDTFPSSSQQEQQKQQRREGFFPSTTAVANQLRPSPLSRINTTTSICRANKKQKIDCSDQNNNIAESAVQSIRLVHEEDARMDLNDQVAYIVKVFLDDDTDIDDGHDNITDCSVDNVDSEDSSSASSDEEAVIERMKVKSKLRAVGTATATATTRSIVDKSHMNFTDPSYSTKRRLNYSKHDAKWEEMYQRLVAYKKEHKHTNVNRRYKKDKEDPTLCYWVHNQRAAYKNRKITEERTRLLDSIGFEWEMSSNNKASWEERFQRLVAYKKEHKHTNVPQRYEEDIHLGYYVNSQRTAYKNKTITDERKRQLDSIGFIWGLPTKNNKAPWEEMYKRLVANKKEHKYTNVPQRYEEDLDLGYWVYNQRIAYRNKKMMEKRKYLLNYIGFEWNMHAP